MQHAQSNGQKMDGQEYTVFGITKEQRTGDQDDQLLQTNKSNEVVFKYAGCK